MAGLENEILLMLGELREGQKRQETAIGVINEKLENEEQRAHENRSRIHERLDKQVREQGEIEGKIITIGLTLTQQRQSKRLGPANKARALRSSPQRSASWRNVRRLPPLKSAPFPAKQCRATEAREMLNRLVPDIQRTAELVSEISLCLP